MRFPRAEAEGPLQLLYMGSRTHDADLALILPELDALAARESRAFRLTLVGGLSQPLQRSWLDVVDVPPEARRYPRFVRWLRRLSRHDLGLAPLVRNAFNGAKSDLKLLDYAAMGVPTLCSPGPAYQDLLDAGLAFAAEPGQWAEQILWAHHHRRRLRRKARAIHLYLWEHRSGDSLASQWLDLLLSLAVFPA
jgi:glycosyltransferase involved in cell wall biosynthesis